MLDLIAAIGGLIIPPAFDFIKKKFIKTENDTPERTIGSLATTKPDVLPEYVKSLADLKDSEVRFFNRDVVGTPSQWVVDLRSAIRPMGVVLAFMLLSGIVFLMFYGEGKLGQSPFGGEVLSDTLAGVRVSCEAIISSWFGDRIRISSR